MDTGRFHRILVPTDFSETADGALGTAIGVARTYGATIELVHVSGQVVVLPPPLELVSLPAVFPDLPRRIEESLQSRAERVRQAGVRCETAVLEGNPHTEIVRFAGERAVDLIVMATHGRSGIGHAVLGSVAERVVHKAPCPVLVVPVRR